VADIADEVTGAPAVVDGLGGALELVLDAEVVELVEDVLGEVAQAP
jgi:hypothetical protein